MKNKKIFTFFITAGMATAMLGNPVWAEDRALLIGISDYQDPKVRDLWGDRDLEIAEKMVHELGYENVKILRESDASRQGIITGLRWLQKGVGPEDHALVYYSGHGDSIPDDNGDESDGQDEFLAPWDVHVGSGGAEGVIVDDEFNMMLSKIKGQTLVLLDSCHSGTATKNMDRRDVAVKSLGYEGVRTKANINVSRAESQTVYTAVSAARDTESAVATTKGSLFTLGMQQVVESAAKSSSPFLSLNNVRDSSAEFIAAMAPQLSASVHHPVVTDESNLAGKNIFIRAQHSYQNDCDAIVNAAGAPLNITPNKREYNIGERISIDLGIPGEGYLNIISIGDDKEVVLLFPNEMKHDNFYHERQNIEIPGDIGGFNWQADGPPGQIAIYAFFTNKPLNFWEKRESKGGNVFTYLTAEEVSQAKEILYRKASISVHSSGRGGENQLSAGKEVITVK